MTYQEAAILPEPAIGSFSSSSSIAAGDDEANTWQASPLLSEANPHRGWYRICVMKFTVILEPELGGGYSIICPAVPGCVSQGNDLVAARSNIREAILLCLDVRRADGLAPVVETPELIAREIQECLEDRAAEGLPLTIETQEVDVEVEVAA